MELIQGVGHMSDKLNTYAHSPVTVTYKELDQQEMNYIQIAHN